MAQFLQAYGVWIVVGVLLLVLLLRFARIGGHHSHGEQVQGQAQQTGTDRQENSGRRHGGCC